MRLTEPDKIGELEISRVRRHAQTILGDRFDFRDFHHAVLRKQRGEDFLHDGAHGQNVRPVAPRRIELAL